MTATVRACVCFTDGVGERESSADGDGIGNKFHLEGVVEGDGRG